MIGLSNYHSNKPKYIKQKIWANLIAYNITEMLVNCAVIEKKETKYEYKVNFTMAAHTCRVFLRLATEKDRYNVTLLLRKEYAFAVKFLEHDDLLEVKEALRMTVLGEMIWEDGYQCCKLQHIVSQICKKLKRGLAIPQIALEVEEDVSYVEKICQVAQMFAPDYDISKIAQELEKNNL